MLKPSEDVTVLNPEVSEFVLQANELIDLNNCKGTEIKTSPSVIALCDILNKGYNKLSSSQPRVNCTIDVNLADLSLHNHFEPLTRLLSDAHGDCADGELEDDDDMSDTTSNSKQSPRRRQHRKRNRTRTPEVSPQPLEHMSASMASQQKRRANYDHAGRRNRDRISKRSDIDVAHYIFFDILRDDEFDLFADVKDCQPADSDRWLARCLFNKESCEVTLETFVQLQYNEIHHPKSWVKCLSSSDIISPKTS